MLAPAVVRAMALAAGLLAAGPSAAQTPPQPIDPHAVYEASCGRCHNEHAADMARQKLRQASGRLEVSRTGQDLERMLRRHYGVQLAPAEWSALSDLMRMGLATGGAFQLRCGRCHDRAVTWAREVLKLESGRLVGRTTRRDVVDFLKGGHGGASASEIESIAGALRRHLETAPRP